MVMPDDFLEKDLEDIIMANKSEIVQKGFPAFYKHVKRQFYLPNGKKIDILTFEISDDNVLKCKVIELKKGVADLQTLLQLLGYVEAVLALTIHHFNEVQIEPIIVGKDSDNFVPMLLSWGIECTLVIYK